MRGSTVVRVLGTATLALFLLAAFTPLATVVDRAVGVPPRIEPADAIVVLATGGVLPDGQLADASLRRAVRGITLHRAGLAPLLVLSGASGQRRSESAARAALARACAVPDAAVLAVTSGTTTREEAATFRSLLQPRGVRRLLLVTDASHMRRARGLFQAAGFDVLPAPVYPVDAPTQPEQRLRLLRDALRESVGLAYYHVAGYL